MDGVANVLSDPRRPVAATLRTKMDTPRLREAGVHLVTGSFGLAAIDERMAKRATGALGSATEIRDPPAIQATGSHYSSAISWSRDRRGVDLAPLEDGLQYLYSSDLSGQDFVEIAIEYNKISRQAGH